MRRALKFLHTLASCGLVGALACYAIVLVYAPQDTAKSFAEVRQTIVAICNYLLLPSLGIALVSGLLAMAAHRPFMDTRWAWLKAILGLSLFEATLGVIQSKAAAAAAEAAKLAAGTGERADLAAVIANEWLALWTIFALSLAQIAIGIWRPRLAKR